MIQAGNTDFTYIWAIVMTGYLMYQVGVKMIRKRNATNDTTFRWEGGNGTDYEVYNLVEGSYCKKRLLIAVVERSRLIAATKQA